MNPSAASPPTELTIDRIGPTRRPAGKAIGYHRWSNLLFVHWRVPAEAVQKLLPAGLTVDTWEGAAWVGLVPFAMSGIRPWWSPAVPCISTFLETNVRTYVHTQGRDPGVWFFSLDASSSLAVRIARWRWCLPYYRTQMSLARTETGIRYGGRRLWPGAADARYEIAVELDPALVPSRSSPAPAGTATPGTLEHFLIERYLLYAQARDGRLLRGQVHHAPYGLREARLTALGETLVAATGIETTSPPCHVIFSEGVTVEIFPLRSVVS